MKLKVDLKVAGKPIVGEIEVEGDDPTSTCPLKALEEIRGLLESIYEWLPSRRY